VNELLAHNRTSDEIAKKIGADWLIYQNLEDLVAAARKGNKSIKRFDTSCFDGHYVTGDVDAKYLALVESQRNDNAKTKRNKGHSEVIELHNAG
jgi:amidophosphoribosyltransferase